MSKSNYIQIEDFTGLNVLSDAQGIRDTESPDCLNVDIYPGYVETAPGYDLWNKDTVTGAEGIKAMFPFYKSDGTKQLIFANRDKWYYLTTAAVENTTWNLIGDYGTEVDNPRGIVYDDQCILGSNNASNALKKWSGTAVTDVTTPPTDKVNIFAVFVGQNDEYVMGAEEGKSFVWWSDTADPDSWNSSNFQRVGLNDSEQVRGMVSRPDEMLIYKNKTKYKRSIFYESETGTWLPRLQGGSDGSGGTIAHDSILIHNESVYALADRNNGIQSIGKRVNFDGDNIPDSLSVPINKLFKYINWKYAHKCRAAEWNRKLFWAVPFGAAQFNNKLFVYHIDQRGWTVHDVPVGSFSSFEDANGVEILLMGSSTEPRIYKYNEDAFSRDGVGYRRTWTTKEFDFGDRMGLKPTRWIDLGGLIPDGGVIDVTVKVDNIETAYQITKDQILTLGESGAYIGSGIVGSEIIGGDSVSKTRLKFIAHIDIGNTQRLGHTVQVKFSNNQPGMFWRWDYLGFDFEKERKGIMPRRNKHILSPIT